jgi:hypothetical protein
MLQAERYDEMVEAMKEVSQLASQGNELSVEERNLMSVGYKNVIGARRASWRILSSIENKERSKGNTDNTALIEQYRGKVCGPLRALRCSSRTQGGARTQRQRGLQKPPAPWHTGNRGRRWRRSPFSAPRPVPTMAAGGTGGALRAITRLKCKHLEGGSPSPGERETESAATLAAAVNLRTHQIPSRWASV